MKKSIKRMGKGFIALKQENEKLIKQSVLIVDDGHGWLEHLHVAIERIKNHFPQAEISVLTFEQRKPILEKYFPQSNYIVPSQSLRPRRYQIALQMLKMSNKRYDYTAIFSLDITPIICALLLFKTRLILYNRWGQWWSLGLRSVREIFRVTYVKKKARFGFKGLLKRMGLFFIILKRQDEKVLKPSILVVDNGYTPFKHLDCSIRRIKELLPPLPSKLLYHLPHCF